MTTDYNKAYGLSPTTRKLTEHNSRKDTASAFAQTTIPTNIHTANIIFTNIILMADKHNISKGKMQSNCMLLPEDIVCKITKRNNIRRENTCDPALKLQNERERKHMEIAPRRSLGSHAQHTHSIQQSTPTHTKHFHKIQ